VKAIGQTLPSVVEQLQLRTDKGKVCVNDSFETNIPNVYAGGDCIRWKGAASTVMGVQDGKLAALSIHGRLMNQGVAHG
jgi:dihydropyrimidine dehydrogenase (NAD+) subunit PreT